MCPEYLQINQSTDFQNSNSYRKLRKTNIKAIKDILQNELGVFGAAWHDWVTLLSKRLEYIIQYNIPFWHPFCPAQAHASTVVLLLN